MNKILIDLGFTNTTGTLYKHPLLGERYFQFNDSMTKQQIVAEIYEGGKRQQIEDFKRLMNIGDPRI